MKPPVLSKADFVRRYIQGEFGNRVPTWDTVEEFLASGYTGLVHLRNRVAGAQTWYNVSPGAVGRLWRHIVEEGLAKPEELYISAMAPEDKKVFQGEVMESPNYLDLTYNLLPLPMREGMAQGLKTAQGIIALELLKHFMCIRSYEWLWYLLDEYPNHVVEFSTYSIDCGSLSGFNTIFWEVRGGY